MNIKPSIAAIAFLSLSCSSTKKTNDNKPNAAVAANLPGTKYVKINTDGSLLYIPDEKGNIIPDFSRVGYYGGDKEIPDVAVVKTLQPTGTDTDLQNIQVAIDEVSKRETDKAGFKGAILLK